MHAGAELGRSIAAPHQYVMAGILPSTVVSFRGFLLLSFNASVWEIFYFSPD
jgi:hypothetical protein